MAAFAGTMLSETRLAPAGRMSGAALATAATELLARFRSISPLAEARTPGLLIEPALVGLSTTRTMTFELEDSAPRLNRSVLPLVTIEPCETLADTREAFAGMVLVN